MTQIISQNNSQHEHLIGPIEQSITLRATHCFKPDPNSLDRVASFLKACLKKLSQDAPRGAISELESAIREIAHIAPLVSPTKGSLGGGISEKIKAADKAGLIEKNHLITNRIMRNEAESQGIAYIDLGTDYHYPFYDCFLPTQEALKAIAKSIKCSTHYPSSYGLEPLRNEFSIFMKNEFGVKLDPQYEIMVTNGASQVFDALSRALAGEYYIIPDLALPTVSTISVGNGAKLLRAPKDKTGWIDLKELGRMLREFKDPSIRFLYFNSPCNPTGAVATPSMLQELISFAHRHHILLVHDMDSWRTVHKSDAKLHNILEFEGAKDIAISIFSVSKEFGLPGLRIGLVCGNKQAINAIRLHNSIFSVMLPECNQFAVLNAIKAYNQMDESLKRSEINRMITEVLEVCVNGWKELGWPSEHIHRPAAGYKFMVAVPENFEDKNEYHKAELFNYYVVKRAKVKLSNSASFNNGNTNYIRIIIMQTKEIMLHAFARLRDIGVRYDMPMPENLYDEYKSFMAHPAFKDSHEF